jgi:chemotaxis signal transduction protein
MSEPTQLRTLLFQVGNAVYGCDIAAVREIVPVRKTTRLPGTPDYVDGLINLRGTILTVIDLGARLEGARGPVEEGSVVIVEVDGRHLGLVVSEVRDVTPLRIDPRPEDRPDEVVLGLGHLTDTVVIILDIPALVKQVLL